MGEVQVNTGLTGFISLWELAKLEGLTHDHGNEHCMGLLLALTKDLEQKPHPKQALAEAGHFVYKYEKKMMNKTSKLRSKTLTATVEHNNLQLADFQAVQKSMDDISAQSGFASFPSSSTKKGKTRKAITDVDPALKDKQAKQNELEACHDPEIHFCGFL